jgi:hypothetical protein
MVKIKDILLLDLQEDIKHVIDLEDRSEQEIQDEIENYIVTEGIAEHLDNFITQYTSNIKETGVWISGFYGSGKSYFGKMLGYILANPMINGTPARERFIPRLKGVSNASLIENSLGEFDSIQSLVVFLDVAKQNTDQGLAFTLFANFLKALGFREDVYGYMEFELFLDGVYREFKKLVLTAEGKEWDELKKSNRLVAKTMRATYQKMGYTEADYNETLSTYNNAIENFDASQFKDELDKYLQKNPDRTIVFIFDEASEAISQKKFSLLDLEGISEALSSISRKVWTIAIAQEKLDDVISNNNVSRNLLTKVTDRFKTKIHLEATEVDVIIRSRLLQKTGNYFTQLENYYKQNHGLVTDATNLKSTFPTKTTSAEDFATYYPFHQYQFDILQKFLFSSNALVATQIAARGMIITTFDVLRKQMRDRALFDFATGHAICSEAQTAPPVWLVNKYDTARKILGEKDLDIDGEKLLKTIHLLSESDVVSATPENITKSYITDITTYFDVKPNIEDALQLLIDAKVLLASNNNYKITSDLEGKLLDEMNEFRVDLFRKKQFLIKHFQDTKFFNAVATLSDGSDTFRFNVISDQDDELTGSGSKRLRLVVYSLFNISDNRQDFVEQIKLDTQNDKDLMTLIPDNRQFSQIDKLIAEIIRYTYMENKYATESDPLKRQIIRDFGVIRQEKEKEFRNIIERAYKNASLIYMFDEYLLNDDTFKGTINQVQRKLVKNIYTKRLPTQLSESLVPRIFSSSKEKLAPLFSGDEFKFFDANGNFIGDHLSVIEEITGRMNTHFVDGRSLEDDLSGPPWGYTFGTIVASLAALFRAGRLAVKFSGTTWFSYKDPAVHDGFTNATKFKSASFKSITVTLSAAQKNQAVQILRDLEIEHYTESKVDWNINDFDLADSIRMLAEHFLSALNTLNDTVENFDALFKDVASQRDALLAYTGKVTENNYIEKVEHLLDTGETYKSSIRTILKAQKFIKKNFSKVREYRRFIEAVSAELKKADRANIEIQDAHDEFFRLFHQDMVNNYAQLQQQAQIVKDNYFKLLKNASSRMSHEYQILEGKIDAVLHDLEENYPVALNQQNLDKVKALKRYCTDRIVPEPVIEFSITCKESGYSLSDVLNYLALVPTKEHELQLIQTGLIMEPPGEGGGPAQPLKVHLQIPGKVMKVREYKSLLMKHLSSLSVAQPDEEIEINIDIQE